MKYVMGVAAPLALVASLSLGGVQAARFLDSHAPHPGSGTAIRQQAHVAAASHMAPGRAGGHAVAPSHAHTTSPSSVRSAQYLVLFVLDGGRPDYFGLTNLPHIDALRTKGVQYSYAIDGILESETPSGHTTLATGSTPRRNGILGFGWAQNDNDYSLFSPDVVRSGAMEHIMSNAHVSTIAGLYKAQHPHAKVVALSGHKYYAADPLGGPQADAIMYYQGDARGRYVPVAIPGHAPPQKVLDASGLTLNTIHPADGQDDAAATRLALSAFATMHQNITLINYPEFDWPLGHVYGGSANRAKVIKLMRTFDTDLGRIEDAYRKRGILNKTLFVITADHGMGTVNRFIPWSVLNNAYKKAGTTATSSSYSTAAYVWLRKQKRAGKVARYVLAAHDPGVQSAYYLTWKGGHPSYAIAPGSPIGSGTDSANRYLLSTLMNGHEPNVVVFTRLHATFSGSNTRWLGDHGGAQWPSQSIPLILSGPGIRQGMIDNQPAQLDDVAPTVLAAMGVQPRGMEGRVLADALQHPNPAYTRLRRQEIQQVTPVVRELLAQRDWEMRHTR